MKRKQKLYLSDMDKETIRLFLEIRLNQAETGLEKFNTSEIASVTKWANPQRLHFKREIGTIKRLISTLNHPIGTVEVDEDKGVA